MLYFVDLDKVETVEQKSKITRENIMNVLESCTYHDYNGKHHWFTAKCILDNRWYSTDDNTEFPSHYYITDTKPEFVAGRMIYVNKNIHKSFMRIAGFDSNHNDIDSLFPINGEINIFNNFIYFKDNTIGKYFGFHEYGNSFILVEDTYSKKMLSIDEVVSVFDEYVVIKSNNKPYITNGRINEGYFEIQHYPENYLDAKDYYDYYSFI